MTFYNADFIAIIKYEASRLALGRLIGMQLALACRSTSFANIRNAVPVDQVVEAHAIIFAAHEAARNEAFVFRQFARRRSHRTAKFSTEYSTRLLRKSKSARGPRHSSHHSGVTIQKLRLITVLRSRLALGLNVCESDGAFVSFDIRLLAINDATLIRRACQFFAFVILDPQRFSTVTRSMGS